MHSVISLCILVLAAVSVSGQSHSGVAQFTDGYVTTPDGVRLFYQKVGAGPQSVILPARLFLIRDFRRLAKGRTLIFYDMRAGVVPTPFRTPSESRFKMMLTT